MDGMGNVLGVAYTTIRIIYSAVVFSGNALNKIDDFPKATNWETKGYQFDTSKML